MLAHPPDILAGISAHFFSDKEREIELPSTIARRDIHFCAIVQSAAGAPYVERQFVICSQGDQ